MENNGKGFDLCVLICAMVFAAAVAITSVYSSQGIVGRLISVVLGLGFGAFVGALIGGRIWWLIEVFRKRKEREMKAVLP